MYQKILIASANPYKIRELRQLLEPLEIELLSTLDFPDGEEVEEDAPDLEGNARKKSRYWYDKTGIPALADDTGLEVDALQGAPGVHSARYAGEPADSQRNMERLLRELEGVKNRSARFRTVISLTGESEHLFEGVCEGEILPEARGSGGFGYDPVFRPSGYEVSFAELSAEEKNRVSHRGRALQKVVAFLREQTGRHS